MPCEDELRDLQAEVKRLRALLTELTPPLETILARRGFRIHKKEPRDDLLLPAPEYITGYYEELKRYSFRLFLRDLIQSQSYFTLESITRYATADVTEEFLEFLVRIGLVKKLNTAYTLLRERPVKSFGTTLEWFLSEILRREFLSETVWGVRFKGRKTGGDYDLIAKVDGARILYMEVKSSPPKQIYSSEIDAFMDRVEDLNPDISLFFMDTELRMKDKIVPMFEEALKKRKSALPMPERLYKELFNIGERIFIINAKGSVEANIERVLSRFLNAHFGRPESAPHS